MNSRKCGICNVNVHIASYVKHLRSKKHLEIENQNELIIPEWLFKEPIENKFKKFYNPKTLKQIARDIIKLDAMQLKKKIAKKMIHPYYFTDRALRVGFNITLESHHVNHAEFGIEVRFIHKIKEELSVLYAILINQYIFKYKTVFLAGFDKQDEDNQVLDETEIFINLNNNHNLTETDINNIDVKSPLEHHIQQQKMKDSGWRFDKINSMTIYFYKTGKINGSSYVKVPLRSNAILNIENNDK